ncbi:hypothetical protein GIB67_014158 [Kingdonia uniflora]|uniref:Uncharacterized protein n=1 Tax=Kingdonia uniflora TaxID=39325 RepID=A0A7J7NCP6_9MAGN|nr:hypothetical protein GIB67_014158 [Kingdonia uniflora]
MFKQRASSDNQVGSFELFLSVGFCLEMSVGFPLYIYKHSFHLQNDFSNKTDFNSLLSHNRLFLSQNRLKNLLLPCSSWLLIEFGRSSFIVRKGGGWCC